MLGACWALERPKPDVAAHSLPVQNLLMTQQLYGLCETGTTLVSNEQNREFEGQLVASEGRSS